MKETPFFFPNGSYNLFGILHEPEVDSNGQGFVFCHPFAEEKLWTHRVYVNFARELARLGYTVLRFDYMGHGDSEGKFENTSVETRLTDIAAAVNWMRDKINGRSKVGLLGLRFGATLASIYAETDSFLKFLILSEPILRGDQYMRELLRINISTQSAVYKEIRHNTKDLVKKMKEGLTVNSDGYEIGWSFYEQAAAINLINGAKSFKGPSLIVSVKNNPEIENKKLSQLKQLYSNSTLISVSEQPFWKEIKTYYSKASNLYFATSQWLRRRGN